MHSFLLPAPLVLAACLTSCRSAPPPSQELAEELSEPTPARAATAAVPGGPAGGARAGEPGDVDRDGRGNGHGDEDEDEGVAAAREALERGDLELAHRLVRDLLFEQRLGVARGLEEQGEPREALRALRRAFALGVSPTPTAAEALRLRLEQRVLAALLERAEPAALEGDPRDALGLLDEALAIAPRDPRVNLLRARAALDLGEEIGEVFLFQDALDSAEIAAAAAPTARYFGARAARLLHYADGDPAPLERSIALARALLDDVRSGRVARGELPASPPPEAVLAEALFDRYRLALSGGEEQRAEALFEAALDALSEWLGHAPDDALAWRRLASLHEWAGDPEEARDVLVRGLALLPEEVSLHEDLARVCRGIGGPAETVRIYEELLERQASSPLAHWFLGQDLLELALERLNEREASPEDFERAEAVFVRTREMAPEHTDACLGREALSRSGAGWVHYWADDLEAAEEAFRSMEDVLAGGLEWQWPDRLLSGVDSLGMIAGKWYERSMEEARGSAERAEALWRAGEIARWVSDYRPDDPSLANDAGFLCREAGVALEAHGRRLLERALLEGGGSDLGGGDSGAGDPGDGDAERARRLDEGRRAVERGLEAMEASYSAYVRASELSPDDARIVNDTGLILTYYLHREPETARRYHERAIEVGTPELEAGGVPEDDDLWVAVGDAYQNLGYLELCWLGNAEAALDHLERSLAYAPETRRDVPGWLMPLARHVLEGRLEARAVVAAHRFGILGEEELRERARATRALEAAFVR